MSQFFSNKYLRYRGLSNETPQRLIDTDLPCGKCDYNLRGLMSGGRCPECGTPIARKPLTEFRLLSDAPLPQIRSLARGLWLAVATVALAPTLMLFLGAVAFFSGSVASVHVGSAMVLLAGMWFVAVWQMTPVLNTPDGARHGFTADSRSRQIARWSQASWFIAVVLLALPPAAGWVGGMALLASLLVGLLGLIALSLVLSRLADWSCDEVAERLLNITIWLLPLSTFLLLLMGAVSQLRLLGCASMLMWVGALVTFGMAVLSLASSATWSVRHAHERMQREAAAKARRVVRDAPGPPSDEPIKLSEPGDPLPPPPVTSKKDALPQLDEIERNVDCRHCGYNLRGLRITGRCPECGSAIVTG